MLQKSNLNLEHKELVSSSFSKINSQLADFSFANIYLFREKHQYQLIFTPECAVITGYTYDNKKFALPLSKKILTNHVFIDNLLKKYNMLYPIPEEWLNFFNSDKYKFSKSDNDSDYLFYTSNIALYPGRNLHKKKNLLNNFNNLFKTESKTLTENTLKDALNVLENWQLQYTANNNETDFFECKEALYNLHLLNLDCLIYYIDNQPAAFIIGEKLNQETYVIHFSKALNKFKGIYQFIYSDFASKIIKNFPYLNMEQDLGLPSLRQAKSSYHPFTMLKKFRVTRNIYQ